MPVRWFVSKAFIKDILVDGLYVKWVMVGDDFASRQTRWRYLHLDRSRQTLWLRSASDGNSRQTRRVRFSSAVRAALAAGDFEHAKITRDVRIRFLAM